MATWTTKHPTSETPYIERPYEQQFPSSALLEKVKIWTFPLHARYAPLKRIVHQHLNLCRRYLFLPVWSPVAQSSVVFLRILQYEKMRPTHPPYCDWGYISQTEVYFAIPVVRWEWGLPVQLALFCPLIFVDHPISLVSGNMVLGYPKGLADFGPGSKPLSGCPSSIKIHAFEKHHKDSKMSLRRLLDVLESAPLESDPQPPESYEQRELWPLGHIDAFFGPHGAFPLPRRALHLFRQCDQWDIVFSVQLRQVRDILNPWSASLQEVVSLAMGLRYLYEGHFLDPVKIKLHGQAGLDIKELLGLKTQGKMLRPVLPFFVRLDMVLTHPQVLHPQGYL